MNDYYEKPYNMSVQESNDKLVLSKQSQTDWSVLQMVTNGESNGLITIRSKETAEGLHFMLSQMLETNTPTNR